MSPTWYDDWLRTNARSFLCSSGSMLMPDVTEYVVEPPTLVGAKKTQRPSASAPMMTPPTTLNASDLISVSPSAAAPSWALCGDHSRYWAATTVTPVRRAAVSCGLVVGQVTVDPAVSVLHV